MDVIYPPRAPSRGNLAFDIVTSTNMSGYSRSYCGTHEAHMLQAGHT